MFDRYNCGCLPDTGRGDLGQRFPHRLLTSLGGAGQTYAQRVLATGPIAYFPCTEGSGLVVNELVNPALQNGVYSRDVSLIGTIAGPIPGTTAPNYDGVSNDYANLYSLTFAAAHNGQLGTVFIWLQVPAAAWTDGAARRALVLEADNNNYAPRFEKRTANNQLEFFYRAGGAIETYAYGTSTTVWFTMAMTWDRVSDLVTYHINGTQVSTDNGLGVFVGNLNANETVIATRNVAAPGSPWVGGAGQMICWDRVVDVPTLQALSTP